MASNYIYVLEDNAYDYSRWLHITLRPENGCVLHLTDLCYPGRISSLGQVPCELLALRNAVDRGALQITLPRGYLLLRRDEEVVHIEFRSYDDEDACRVILRASDLQARVAALEEQSQTMVSVQ
jgi:hypothetical protein